ncbi:MAG: potassium channel family protein [Candidatus Thiodiazotropha sp.]
MLLNLILGLSTMVLCLLLQSVLLLIVLRFYAREKPQIGETSFWNNLMVVKSIMLLLVAGNLGQSGIWALLFQALGEFAVFRDAFYHSAVNFATLGYGDVVMSEQHRLLGPMEAINGVLMIGVSTAALMAAFQDIMKKGPIRQHIERDS